jgi:hypothetical protein
MNHPPFIEFHCSKDCNLDNYLKFIIYVFKNSNTALPNNLKFNLYQNGSLINYMSLGDYIDIYGLSNLNQDVKRLMKNNLNIEKRTISAFERVDSNYAFIIPVDRNYINGLKARNTVILSALAAGLWKKVGALIDESSYLSTYITAATAAKASLITDIILEQNISSPQEGDYIVIVDERYSALIRNGEIISETLGFSDKFDKVYNKNQILKRIGMKSKGIQNKRFKKYRGIIKNRRRDQSIRRGGSKCRIAYTNIGNGNVPQYVCWD